MADRTIYSNECALNEATVISLSIADPGAGTPTVGKLRLFDNSLVPDSSTTRAILVAAETDLGGYPAGGYDIETMGLPQLVPGGGAAITTPLIPISYTTAPAGVLGGAWIEDPDDKVRAIFVFDPFIALNTVGEGFQFVRQLVYGRPLL